MNPRVPRKRRCTDMIFVLCFIVFIAFFIYTSVKGFREGNLDNIAETIDSSGTACGPATSNYHFLFIPDTDDLETKVCVERCPKGPNE